MDLHRIQPLLLWLLLGTNRYRFYSYCYYLSAKRYEFIKLAVNLFSCPSSLLGHDAVNSYGLLCHDIGSAEQSHLAGPTENSAERFGLQRDSICGAVLCTMMKVFIHK